MSETLYLLTLCLPLVTIALVFGLRSFASIQQAKATLANDEAYRRLAETAIAADSRNSAALASIQTSLADVGTRLAAIEKMLREVE